MEGTLSVFNLYLALTGSTLIMLTVIFIGGLASMIRKFSIRTYLEISPELSKFIDEKFTFIGVIHHELSHILLALLTGAKVTGFKLLENKDGTLGHVDIVPRGNFFIRMLQLALCGSAPVICGSITLYLIYYFGFYINDLSTPASVVLIVLAMHIGYHMSMSPDDGALALRGSFGIYVITAIFLLFFPLNYEAYRGFLILVLGLMFLNWLVAVLFRLLILFRR